MSYKKRWIIVSLILLVVFGGLIAFNVVRDALIARFIKNFKPAPVSISTSVAKEIVWEPHLFSVGSVAAINGVTVTPEVAGTIQKINFHSGEIVKAGQSLIEMDTDLVRQDLKSNEAKLKLDKLDFERKKKLYQTGAVSASDYDTALSTMQQTQALVDKNKVTIEKKNIRAPFDGKLGIRQVNIGQYLNPGDAIVTLQQMDPVFVNFTLPQQYLPQLYLGQKIGVSADLYPNETFYGKLTAVNAQVTAQTRNIELQATIPNPGNKLYPGIFVNTNVYLPTKKPVVIVPETAVSYSLYGDVIYVITPTKEKIKGKPVYHSAPRYVDVGKIVGSDIIITKGLKPGEMVATSGQLKLTTSNRVFINNAVKLESIQPSHLDGGA